MTASIPAELPSGGLFQGRYQVVRCIKSGGMGSVYEVIDVKTASRRALKVMLPQLLSNDALRARFELEAKITGSIESDHLVRVLDAGVDAESKMPFLVMELLRGEDLGSIVQNRAALPPEEVVLYMGQTARALDKTHAANVVHRDLKPDNLFLTVRDDDTPCVKILDFGIAKTTDVSVDGVQTRPMMGTPLYMSPEQMRAEKVGPATDIYALAHIAYALLTGEPYWTSELDDSPSPFLLAVEVLQGVQERPSVRAHRRKNIHLPEAFDAWFITATARAPDERFSRASLAAATLAEAFGIEPLARFSRTPNSPHASAPPGAPVVDESGPHQGAARTAREPARRTAIAAPKTDPHALVANPNESSPKTESSSSAPVTGVGLKKKGFLVDVDTRRAIVKVTVWGFWNVEDGQAYLAEFKRGAAKVIGRPWYVLADISEFTAQKPEVSAFLEQTMSYALNNGLVKAANLVSSSLGKMQISRLSQAMGLPEFSFFQTEPQAIEWLLFSAA